MQSNSPLYLEFLSIGLFKAMSTRLFMANISLFPMEARSTFYSRKLELFDLWSVERRRVKVCLMASVRRCGGKTYIRLVVSDIVEKYDVEEVGKECLAEDGTKTEPPF